MTCWILAVGRGGNSMGRLWYCLRIDLVPDLIIVALPTANLPGSSRVQTLYCRRFDEGRMCQSLPIHPHRNDHV